VKTPTWLERARPPVRLAPPADAEALEALEDVALLEDLEVYQSEDEALLEIAEQTPYGEVLLEDLVRRQLTLAISVAAVFLVILLGLPIMNLLFPDLVAMRLLGLPMSWLTLAVLIYPFVWALAWYFVSTSRKYEEEFTELVK